MLKLIFIHEITTCTNAHINTPFLLFFLKHSSFALHFCHSLLHSFQFCLCLFQAHCSDTCLALGGHEGLAELLEFRGG